METSTTSHSSHRKKNSGSPRRQLLSTCSRESSYFDSTSSALTKKETSRKRLLKMKTRRKEKRNLSRLESETNSGLASEKELEFCKLFEKLSQRVSVLNITEITEQLIIKLKRNKSRLKTYRTFFQRLETDFNPLLKSALLMRLLCINIREFTMDNLLKHKVFRDLCRTLIHCDSVSLLEIRQLKIPGTCGNGIELQHRRSSLESFPSYVNPQYGDFTSDRSSVVFIESISIIEAAYSANSEESGYFRQEAKDLIIGSRFAEYVDTVKIFNSFFSNYFFEDHSNVGPIQQKNIAKRFEELLDTVLKSTPSEIKTMGLCFPAIATLNNRTILLHVDNTSFPPVDQYVKSLEPCLLGHLLPLFYIEGNRKPYKLLNAYTKYWGKSCYFLPEEKKLSVAVFVAMKLATLKTAPVVKAWQSFISESIPLNEQSVSAVLSFIAYLGNLQLFKDCEEFLIQILEKTDSSFSEYRMPHAADWFQKHKVYHWTVKNISNRQTGQLDLIYNKFNHLFFITNPLAAAIAYGSYDIAIYILDKGNLKTNRTKVKSLRKFWDQTIGNKPSRLETVGQVRYQAQMKIHVNRFLEKLSSGTI